MPGLVASYDIQPGNRVGLFWWNGKGWKSKKIDEASKKQKGEKWKILKDRVEGGQMGKWREKGKLPQGRTYVPAPSYWLSPRQPTAAPIPLMPLYVCCK